mgnify:CR=1 FL=1
MSLLDNIDKNSYVDVRGSADAAKCVLLPLTFQHCCIIVLTKTEDSIRCVEILRERISYLFYGYDYQFDVSDDEDYGRSLGLEHHFLFDQNKILVVIQFNHRYSKRSTIRMYVRLFMSIEASYIEDEAMNSYITEVVSLFSSKSNPKTYLRDYSTRVYTLGIIWKYYYLKKRTIEFKHIEHLIKCMYYKLYDEIYVYDEKAQYIEQTLKDLTYGKYLRQTRTKKD